MLFALLSLTMEKDDLVLQDVPAGRNRMIPDKFKGA
jgi:hypothetical protein